MNKKQENKLSMYQATEEHLDNTTDIWKANGIFSKSAADYKTEVGNLRKLTAIQSEDITGYALKKEKLEEEVIKCAILIASGLYTYSFVNNDDPLRKSVDVSPSYLRRLRDNEMYDTCLNIYNKGKKNISVLADCGVSEDMVKNLETSLKDFDTIISTPRDMIDTRSTATEQIIEKFEQIDSILKNILDKLIHVYEYSNPEFFTKYQKARIIVDLGVRHTKEVEQ